MDAAISKHGVLIRLTLERWFHIEENHDDLAGRHSDILEAVEDPDLIIRGSGGELIAARKAEGNKTLVVVYRERSTEDGFIITAYLTSRLKSLMKRGVVWQRAR